VSSNQHDDRHNNQFIYSDGRIILGIATHFSLVISKGYTTLTNGKLFYLIFLQLFVGKQRETKSKTLPEELMSIITI
jgi:hypothetical protein